MTNIQAISRWLTLALLAGLGGLACSTPMVVDAKASPDSRAGAAGNAAGDAGARRDAGSDSEGSTDAATSQPSAAGGGAGTAGHAATDSDSSQAGRAGSAAAQSDGAAGQAQASRPAAPNPNAVAACMGKPSSYVCDATTLYHCDGTGAYDRKTACTTAGECGAGLTSGTCGSCDPGQFRCTGASLEKCGDTGSWAASDTCASPDLCMADASMCMTMACAMGDFHCMGDELQTCNQSLTGFETKETCNAGLCNDAAKRCNECVPDSKMCAGATTLIVCSTDGMQMQQPCSGDTPFCVTDQCVQCSADQDCSAAASDCGTLACVSGSCTAALPKPPETACTQVDSSPGVCDLGGNCVACITDTDCHDSGKRCNPLNLLTPCETRNPLEVVGTLGSGYTVTVAPGYSVSVKRDDGAESVSITENFFTTYCAGPSNPCSIPSSSDTRTLMVSSPTLTAPCSLPLPADYGAGDEADLAFGVDPSTIDGGAASCNLKIELVASLGVAPMK